MSDRIPDSERAWYWRRRRNQSFGYWEDIRSGEMVGPIPLDDKGRAAFVPAFDQDGNLVRKLGLAWHRGWVRYHRFWARWWQRR